MKNKIISFLLAALMLFALTHGVAAEEEIFEFYITSENEAVLLYCDQNARGDVVIPEMYGEYPVTSIEFGAFSNCTAITSVTIPETVTRIEYNAFLGCENLKSVSLPSTLTKIPQNAFANCKSLEIINIPETVNFIGDSAFSGCRALENVKLPAGLKSIERNIFGGCRNLSSVEMPVDAETIGELAFSGCPITQIVIPESVKTIGIDAFSGCPLTIVHIPANVESIGAGAFYNLDTLENVSVAESNEYYYSKDGCLMEKGSDTLIAATKALVIPEGTKKIGEGVFSYLSSDEIGIPEGVTHIGTDAFYQSSIKKVEFPESLISIGEDAFSYCRELESIVLPYGLKEIGRSAFFGCENLSDIGLYSHITRIAESAFQYTEYYNNNDNWENGVLYIGTNLIKAETSITDAVAVKDGTTCIADHAFESCRNITEVNFPASLKAIGGGAFRLCDKIESVDLSHTQIKTLPNCDTEYYYGTFQDCTKLSEVLLPDTLESIGVGAFRYTKSLESIKLPEGIVSIDASAFSYSTELSDINLPDSLRTIDAYAFSNCGKLQSIVFPDSLTYVGINPLSGTAYYNNETNWEDGILYNGKYLLESKCNAQSYTVKDGTVLIAREAFSKYLNSVKSVSLPEGLLYICDDAFYYSKLESITIPKTVVYIGRNAFYARGDLASAYFEDSEVWYLDGEKIPSETVGDADSMAELFGTGGVTDMIKKYVVAFANYDGEELASTEYFYGEIPEYPDVHPEREDSDGYTYTFDKWDKELTVCTSHKTYTAVFYAALKGDVDGEEGVSANDAIYLLYNVFFGDDRYFVSQDCDFDSDGSVTASDAIYLLYNVFFGNGRYPLY